VMKRSRLYPRPMAVSGSVSAVGQAGEVLLTETIRAAGLDARRRGPPLARHPRRSPPDSATRRHPKPLASRPGCPVGDVADLSSSYYPPPEWESPQKDPSQMGIYRVLWRRVVCALTLLGTAHAVLVLPAGVLLGVLGCAAIVGPTVTAWLHFRTRGAAPPPTALLTTGTLTTLGALAATADGTLALACDENQDHATTLRILRVGGDQVEVPIPGSVVVSLAAHPNGFLLALTGRDSVYAHLNLDGHLTLGPRLDPAVHAGTRFFSGSLGVVRDSHRGGTIHRVGEDLTSLPVGEAPTGAYAGVIPGGWVQAGRVFVSGSLPRGRGERPWWPLDHQPELPAGRTVNRYQLVSELDPDSLQPISSTLAPTGPLDLAVDDIGTVWVTAAGDLHRCPPGNGALAGPVDLTTLLDGTAARVIGG